jgi:pyridinium-3,5-biscarboxylic acid mononucleotide synthase
MELDEILNSLKSGKMGVPDARKLLSLYSLEQIEDFAKIDTGRKIRRGIPEVIFAEKKQLIEIKKIILKVLKKSNSVLLSRIKKNDFSKLQEFSKKNKFKTEVGKNSTSLLIYKKTLKIGMGKVGILTAGTSDIGVAEEARLMCKAMNCDSICSYDVGVAGLHRVLPVLKEFIKKEVDSIIVVAGMEGALATIVSSSVDVPVIGVPTSVGYGYGEKGIAALASMLQSCALGLAVVNIDNGIGAGSIAASIAKRANRKKTKR